MMASFDPIIEDPSMSRPFYRLLGLRADSGQAPGDSKIHFDSQPDFENSRGDVHGGVVASLLDAAMGVAVRSSYVESEGATTASMTVNFLEPGRGTLIAKGHVIRAGRILASVEAMVVDSQGHVVAHAVGTLRIIARRE